MAILLFHNVRTVWTALGNPGVNLELVQVLVGEKRYDISWAHVELVAGLGKLKQAADAEHKDY
jgi:hypothetical protein